MDNNIVSGWSLFGGKNQKLTIYFEDNTTSGNSEAKLQPVQYKKKNEKQCQRDIDRAKAHANGKKHQDNGNSTGNMMILRSMDTNSEDKELPRSDSYNHSDMLPTTPGLLFSPCDPIDNGMVSITQDTPSPTPAPVCQDLKPESPKLISVTDIPCPESIELEAISEYNNTSSNSLDLGLTNKQCIYAKTLPAQDHISGTLEKCNACHAFVCSRCMTDHNKTPTNSKLCTRSFFLYM